MENSARSHLIFSEDSEFKLDSSTNKMILDKKYYDYKQITHDEKGDPEMKYYKIKDIVIRSAGISYKYIGTGRNNYDILNQEYKEDLGGAGGISAFTEKPLLRTLP